MKTRGSDIGLWSTAGLLSALVVLPFLLRPSDAEPPAHAERLVVLSPHNEAVRYEFGLGFRQYMLARGRNVLVDWRTPGGTAEISRYL
ncbi:MAG TPA: hypothetical protein VLC09_00360, partial [Polyangiaceae bacterium]|nr:hypothetical protein [Polyangiaceae bacterium]